MLLSTGGLRYVPEAAFNQIFPGSGKIKVLDLCGAPGGKSTHLSSLIGDRGFLVANEVIRSRASVLAESITKWGASNTIVTSNDPSSFASLTNYFDLMVIDAPCSGEGMFRDRVALEEWSVSNAAMCSDRQKRILMNVWPSLKQGSILIYSTCTFNPAENEENIKWLTGKVAAESIRLNTGTCSGIEEISFKGITGYGFYPGKIKGEGFFLSCLRKLESSAGELFKKKRSESPVVLSNVRLASEMIKTSDDNLYRHNDTILRLSLPKEELLYLKNCLLIIKAGTAVFKARDRDISPLHELAMSCQINDATFQVCELDYRDALSFLRKENLNLKNRQKGWILVRYLGMNLGFAKNIGTRINNYYPVEWRIRVTDPSHSDERPVIWK